MKNSGKGFAPYPLPDGGGGGGVTPEQVNQLIDIKLVPVNQAINTISDQAQQAEDDSKAAVAQTEINTQAISDVKKKVDATDSDLKNNNTINKSNTALQEIAVKPNTGLDISSKVDNKQIIEGKDATKGSKGVVQVGDNIDVNADAVISTQGGSGGVTPEQAASIADAEFDKKIVPTTQAVTRAQATADATNTTLSQNNTVNKANSAVQSVNGKSGNNPVLAASDVGAYSKAQTDAALGIVEAEVAGLQNQTTTIQNNMKKISSVVKVNDVEQATTPIDSTTWKLPIPITIDQPTPISTTSIQYWNFIGTPIISFDNSIIPSVSNFVQTAPFPSKEMNITMKIVNGFYSTTKYILINTCVASKDTISTEEKKLISGAFDSSMTDAQIFSSLVSQTDPTNQTQMSINWIVPPETQPRGVQLGFTRSQFSAFGSMNGIASYLQTTLRGVSFSELRNCLVNWNTNTKQFILFLNNGESYFTYSSPSFNYPFNAVLKLNLDSTPKPVIGNPITIGLTSVVSPTKKLARPSYQTNDSVNMITVDTGFCTFRFDVSLIKATPTMIKNNQVVIKVTAPSYTAVQVANPNQYFNRYASNTEGGTKWLETTNKILDQGDITNSPQIVAEYSNNELNGTAERNLVELTLNYAQWQQNTSQWSYLYIPTYKSVIAPLNNYTLRVIVIADDGIVPSPYTVNGAKTFTYDFPVQVSWYKNGQILTPFIIQCDNNNIQLLAYDLPITSMSSEIGSYSGKTDGQSNLALGLDALVTGYKIMPEISECNGVSQDIQTIDGLDYYLFTLTAGNVYNLIVTGYVAFSTYFDSSLNPLLVGLINANDKTNIYATPVQCKVSFDKRHKVNKNKTIIQIDLSNTTEDQVFRFLMSTANGVIGCRAIIYDSIVLNFKSN